MDGIGHLGQIRKVVDVLKVHVMEVGTAAILIHGGLAEGDTSCPTESPIAEVCDGFRTDVAFRSDEMHGLSRGGGPDAISEANFSDLKGVKKMRIGTNHDILLYDRQQYRMLVLFDNKQKVCHN